MSFVTELSVPKEFVGFLLGKQGSKIEILRQNFDVKIQVLTWKAHHSQGRDWAVLGIEGDEASCLKVVDLLKMDCDKVSSFSCNQPTGKPPADVSDYGPRGGPRPSLDKYGEVAQDSSSLRDLPYYKAPFPDMVSIVPVGVRDPSNFREARTLMLGDGGKRIMEIVGDLGGKSMARIRLRGVGSNFFEGPGGGELDEPMHFNVSAQNSELLDEAVKRVREIIASARLKMTGVAEDAGSREIRRSNSRDRERDERSDSRDRDRGRGRDRERDVRGGRSPERSDSRDRDPSRGRDRERDVRGGRSPERSDSRDRDRSRGRDRERDVRGGRSPERSDSRDRDRGRGGDRGRDCSDSRDREGRWARDREGGDYGKRREKERERERGRERVREPEREKAPKRSRSKESVAKLPFRIESLGGTFINMSICIPHPPGKTAAVEDIVCTLEQQVHAFNLTIKRLTAAEIGAFNWQGTHAIRLTGSASDCEKFQSSVDGTVHDMLNSDSPPAARKRKAEAPVSAVNAPALAAQPANALVQPTVSVVVDPRLLRKAQQNQQPQKQQPQQHQQQSKLRGGSTPVVGQEDADEWGSFFGDADTDSNIIP